MTPTRKIFIRTIGLALCVGNYNGAKAVTSELSQGWALRSQNQVADSGTVVSQVGYDVSGWYPITVPSTVMAGLVANGVYTNIFFGNNLQSVPDLTTQNWWYRDEFTAPPDTPGQQYWLRFKGIAYRARIWLNGSLLDSNAVGTLVSHEYNVTDLIHPGSANALALEVTPPSSSGTNLSFWYVDWNPKPPDMNAGLWGEVLLDVSGPVVLRDPYVKTVLPLPATNSADLTVYLDACNGSSNTVIGELSGQITKPGYPTITLSTNVSLAAHERREIAFDPTAFSQLHVANPALWWPAPLGSSELYHLQLTFSVSGVPSDTGSLEFGTRQFTDYVSPPIFGNTYRGYKVNGQNVLIRGADYVWDMLMRWDTKTNQTHMQYARDMGLNLIRFEGILGNEEIYDLADQEGIMLMPGFVCCSYWASWGSWTAEDNQVGTNSLESQMRLLRAHPGALVWAYGSDELPSSSVLTEYHNIATALHWQNPTLDNLASFNNPSGGIPKMNGPYVWEPPVYWYADTNRGGAFGFCAEQGGESVPPEESLKKFIAPADLWPIGSIYGYHAGASPFDNLNFYSPAVNNRYGTATNATQYADRAQLLNYESERAQFEAYGANAYTLAQGTVYWMLDNGWPSVHWNLYDYFFKPGGGYFGTKKALEPIHILYDYSTNQVKVFNSTLTDASNLTASVKMYNIPDLTLKYTNQVTMSFPASTSTEVFTVPSLVGLTTTYFLRLQLTDSNERLVSDNLYWYSTSPDVLGNSSTWYNTSIDSYADLTGLNSLPPNTNVTVSATRTISNGQEMATITLANTSPTNIAFFVRAEVTCGENGSEVLPIRYTDNYVTLWPGETTTLTAQYESTDLGGQPAFVRIRGYNVPEFSIAAPLSVFRITAVNLLGNDIEIVWDTIGGQTNVVQAAAGGVGGEFSTNFIDISSPIIVNGSGIVTTNFLDGGAATNSPALYYRVRLVP
ncbi:MAG TPA: glycoside hydrolase [Verrucomicrobiae bacterium]|nr:glycoside hydrolase [Verrucomicrobiae bacterium]